MSKGFRDLRTDAELLASSRPPKDVEVRTQNLVNDKLLGAVQRTKGILSKLKTAATITAAVASGGSSLLSQQIGQYALKAAAKKALATAAQRTRAAIEGKVGSAAGQLRKNGLGSVTKFASGINLGVRVIEETDLNKLRRPFPEGTSVNPLQAAEQLSKTTARMVTKGLLSAPLGKGVPELSTIFRTKDEIQQSVRFWDVRRSDAGNLGTSTAPTPGPPPAVPNSAFNQHGLLQDEIFYRLVLIAENIYAPLTQYTQQRGWGRLTILEGFRSENSGVSPHERGEAIDVTIGSGTLGEAEKLWELARWAKSRLVFDQLILCHSLVPAGAGQAWLHITFSPEMRRRLVFSKSFNDEFVEGLVIYDPYTGAEEQAARAAAQAEATLATEYLDILATRQQELNPIGVNTVEGFTSEDGNTTDEECITYVDPWGQEYVPDVIRDLYFGRVSDAFERAKTTRPDLFEQVQTTGFRANPEPHRNFLSLVVNYVNDPLVGIVGIRGNANDLSGDAIAILHPTGGPQGKEDNKWETERRICVVDIIAKAGSPEAAFGWIDHTCLASSSINPVFAPARTIAETIDGETPEGGGEPETPEEPGTEEGTPEIIIDTEPPIPNLN
jgi:hypothetical protein